MKRTYSNAPQSSLQCSLQWLEETILFNTPREADSSAKHGLSFNLTNVSVVARRIGEACTAATAITAIATAIALDANIVILMCPCFQNSQHKKMCLENCAVWKFLHSRLFQNMKFTFRLIKMKVLNLKVYWENRGRCDVCGR